ncbi:hypothetical protein D3C79_1093520 [compost metagenome]
MQLNPQQTDRGTIAQLCRIVSSWQAAELQQPRFRRVSEARLAFQHTGPGITLGIHYPVQHER